MSDFISVARVTDVPSGEGRVVEAGDVPIALFNVDGTFHALDNTCLHRGGPLGDGVCAPTSGPTSRRILKPESNTAPGSKPSKSSYRLASCQSFRGENYSDTPISER